METNNDREAGAPFIPKEFEKRPLWQSPDYELNTEQQSFQHFKPNPGHHAE